MKKSRLLFVTMLGLSMFYACSDDDAVDSGDDDNGSTSGVATPTSAFDEFNASAVTVSSPRGVYFSR